MRNNNGVLVSPLSLDLESKTASWICSMSGEIEHEMHRVAASTYLIGWASPLNPGWPVRRGQASGRAPGQSHVVGRRVERAGERVLRAREIRSKKERISSKVMITRVRGYYVLYQIERKEPSRFVVITL